MELHLHRKVDVSHLNQLDLNLCPLLYHFPVYALRNQLLYDLFRGLGLRVLGLGSRLSGASFSMTCFEV
jgi:hypothetical protein